MANGKGDSALRRKTVRRMMASALAAGMIVLAAGARAQGRFEGGPRQGAKTLSLSGSVTGGDIPTVGGAERAGRRLCP